MLAAFVGVLSRLGLSAADMRDALDNLGGDPHARLKGSQRKPCRGEVGGVGGSSGCARRPRRRRGARVGG